MLANSGKAASVVSLLAPVDAANTTAATGTGVLFSQYEGDLMITQTVGVVTAGQIAGKLQECDDDAGTGAADISGATFTAVTTSNDPLVQKITVDSGSLSKAYIRYVGTITTGPAAVAVVMHARPKYL